MSPTIPVIVDSIKLATDSLIRSHTSDPELNVSRSLKQIDRADSRHKSMPDDGFDFSRPAQDKHFPLTRCFYFCIETTTPDPRWALDTSWYEGPILLLGMSAIILGPGNGSSRFGSSSDFDQMMEMIDHDSHEFYLDHNAIWLPNSALKGSGHKRGAVYRLSLRAFQLAYNFTEDRLSPEAYLEKMSDMRDEFHFSEEETYAFKQWDQKLLEAIKKDYRENRAEMLPKRARLADLEF